jgi:hypothetical protein
VRAAIIYHYELYPVRGVKLDYLDATCLDGFVLKVSTAEWDVMLAPGSPDLLPASLR